MRKNKIEGAIPNAGRKKENKSVFYCRVNLKLLEAKKTKHPDLKEKFLKWLEKV
jgi:hypothetical protein